MRESEIEELARECTPLDKSWLMRLGVLDLLAKRTDTIDFISGAEEPIADDLEYLSKASAQWLDGEQEIEVGESGTLFRFLQFMNWAQGHAHTFIKSGSLRTRKVTLEPGIVNLSVEQLLTLDNFTSQWASAAVLLGATDPVPQPTPHKLALTYQAKLHWEVANAKNRRWAARPDETIERQAKAFLTNRHLGHMAFTAFQAEDYCFARAFGLMTPEEGENRWPTLRTQESDRLTSMEEALDQKVVDSKDHRVVQAIAMAKAGENVVFLHPTAVNKSWPRFWEFMDDA